MGLGNLLGIGSRISSTSGQAQQSLSQSQNLAQAQMQAQAQNYAVSSQGIGTIWNNAPTIGAGIYGLNQYPSLFSYNIAEELLNELEVYSDNELKIYLKGYYQNTPHFIHSQSNTAIVDNYIDAAFKNIKTQLKAKHDKNFNKKFDDILKDEEDGIT